MTKRQFSFSFVRPAGMVVLIGLFLAGWASPLAAQPVAGGSSVPNFSIGAKEYPDADAVVLRWDQTWRMEKDGTVSYRDHRWVKLLNSRAIGAFADPRIDYCVGQDELKIHVAQTTLPDGRVVPVPSYSFNVAGPDDVAGWVEYKDWQQKVVSFSGIEDGCVVEMDYELITRAGVLPWLEGDVRLQDDYPVVERTIGVGVPSGTPVQVKLQNVNPEQGISKDQQEGGVQLRTYAFRKLEAARGEAQSLPWPRRDARLSFTTCGSPEAFAKAHLQRIEDAARPSEDIRKFAEGAAEKESDPREQIRKVARKLADSFNSIASPKAARPLTCRSAGDVLRANYGHSLEAAAVLAAALRALDLKVTPLLAVDADLWAAETPVRSAVWGVVLSVETPDGPVLVHPQQGILQDPGPHGRRYLLGLDGAGKVVTTYLATRAEKSPSELLIAGRLSLTADGKVSGDLRISLTGAFYDPGNLETSAQQESLVKSLVGRVVSGVDLSGHAISMLSKDRLTATTRLASKSPLKALGNDYLLQLGDGPGFLPEFPLPVGVAGRRTDVSLPGPFNERVDLVIELPEGWEPLIAPAAVALVKDRWGEAEQVVEVSGRTVRWLRRAVVTAERVSPEAWPTLRGVVNDLKADAARTVLAGLADKSDKAEATGKKTAAAQGAGGGGG